MRFAVLVKSEVEVTRASEVAEVYASLAMPSAFRERGSCRVCVKVVFRPRTWPRGIALPPWRHYPGHIWDASLGRGCWVQGRNAGLVCGHG